MSLIDGGSGGLINPDTWSHSMRAHNVIIHALTSNTLCQLDDDDSQGGTPTKLPYVTSYLEHALFQLATYIIRKHTHTRTHMGIYMGTC